MIKGIIFDLDGVLIETEKETFNFYQKQLAKQGIALPDDNFKYKAGQKSVDFWNNALTTEQKKIIDTKALTDLKRQEFIKYPKKYIHFDKQVKKVIKKLKGAGYKIAIASQNEQAMIDAALKTLRIKKMFEAIFSIKDTKKLKPDPEIYLLAAKALNLEPNECLVVEDSLVGIAAAKAAGMKCVAMLHDYYPKNVTSQADYSIVSIQELTDEKIKTW